MGFQGINYQIDENILIADNVEQFIDAFEKIQQDENLSQSIQRNARKLIVEEYSNQKVIKDIIATFQKHLSNK